MCIYSKQCFDVVCGPELAQVSFTFIHVFVNGLYNAWKKWLSCFWTWIALEMSLNDYDCFHNDSVKNTGQLTVELLDVEQWI